MEHAKIRGNVAEPLELLLGACPLTPENVRGNII